MHILDFMMWMLMVFAIHRLCKTTFRELAEAVAYTLVVSTLLTVIYVILFAFYPFNWIDVFSNMSFPRLQW